MLRADNHFLAEVVGLTVDDWGEGEVRSFNLLVVDFVHEAKDHWVGRLLNVVRVVEYLAVLDALVDEDFELACVLFLQELQFLFLGVDEVFAWKHAEDYLAGFDFVFGRCQGVRKGLDRGEEVFFVKVGDVHLQVLDFQVQMGRFDDFADFVLVGQVLFECTDDLWVGGDDGVFG
jgi:hypothetical protein